MNRHCYFLITVIEGSIDIGLEPQYTVVKYRRISAEKTKSFLRLVTGYSPDVGSQEV